MMLGGQSYEGAGVDEVIYENISLQSKILQENKELQKSIAEVKELRSECMNTRSCPPVTLNQVLRSVRMFHWMLQNGYLAEESQQSEKLTKLLSSLLELAQLKNESLKHLQSKKLFLASRILQLKASMMSLSIPEEGNILRWSNGL